MKIERRDLEELYRAYGSMVYRRALRILGSEEQARDAMQDIFVKVIRSHETFRGEASATTWLYRITTNLCLNRIRNNKKRREILAAHARANGDVAPGSTANRLDVIKVLHKLPDDLSAVAVYYYLDGLGQLEIAELLGVARRTISFRLQRFREEARALLGHELSVGDDPGDDPGEEMERS